MSLATTHVSATPVRLFEPLHLVQAEHFWARLKGLLGTAYWPPNAVLLLSPCSSVHTAFMRYPIDIVFVDRRGIIVRIAPCVAPWRAAAAWRAHAVLELAAGRVRELRWRPGQQLPASLCPWLQTGVTQQACEQDATHRHPPNHGRWRRADFPSSGLDSTDSLFDGYADTLSGSFVQTRPPAA